MLVKEYELVKAKYHPEFRFINEWANARRIEKKTFFKYYNRYSSIKEVELLLPQKRGPKHKVKPAEEEKQCRDHLFSILHSPPKDYDIHRTSWRLQDLLSVLKSKEININKPALRKILRVEGYKFKNARKVLTSTDPLYNEKLKEITAILSTLNPKDKFFSIDEYGPFSIKVKGGKSLTASDEIKVVPQIQRSKGTLIMTAALELSTNQVTHFFSEKKDTEEMLKLFKLLIAKYTDQERLYFSWDAASWHSSKKIYEAVAEHNKKVKRPLIILSPLPVCAQFLNVIESVFSGMARGIIHNSNYQCVEECKNSINKYIADRNEFYLENPKRAGKKLWGKERTEPEFNESNNCKDSKYLHNFK
jgi:hypothetical protein